MPCRTMPDNHADTAYPALRAAYPLNEPSSHSRYLQRLSRSSSMTLCADVPTRLPLGYGWFLLC